MIKSTTWLNIAAISVSALLLCRFFITGGPQMLRMMSMPVAGGHPHHHEAGMQ
jgi:hypothetical protein